MSSAIKKILGFKRKKAPPLACHLTLDQDENHVHTAACFLEVEPLAFAELFQSQGCASCPPAKDYVRRWGRNSLYTPMVVVSGVADRGSAGGTRAEIEGVATRAREAMRRIIADRHMYLDANDTDVRIDSDWLEAEKHDVFVIVYEDRSETFKIPRGPNKGKKVVHKNVVKDLLKIGEWVGSNAIMPLPVSPAQMAPGIAAVIIVQAPMGGPIAAVTTTV
ncbi:thioredoxin-like protein [Biscogniauxia marginata]|nr:thioredoxin-like protein [Biscogniauxia marginata]